MNKNIVVFMASPRENGNSDKLAESFVKGATKSGNTVKIVKIRDYNIKGCIGCEYCYEHNGECAQNDDMQQIYKLLEKADIIVFSTPIYYQSFPSQLKAVIDRLYVTENKEFPIQGAVLLATYATSGEDMSKQTIEYYKCLIQYHNWKNEGVITVSSLDGVNDILNNRSLLQAEQLGSKI